MQRTGGTSIREYAWLLPGALIDEHTSHQEAGRIQRSVRDWVVDTVFVVISLGWATMIALLDSAAWHRSNLVLTYGELGLSAAACLAVWFRRRAPVTVAVLLLPATVLSSMTGLAEGLVLFTVAVHRHLRVALGVGALYTAALGLRVGLHLSELPDTPQVLLASAAFVACGMLVRARRQLVLSLRERARQAEADAPLREEKARHLERERIAREMHDVLAHRISLLSLHAGAMEYRKDATPEELAQAASVIRHSAHHVLGDLRDIIAVLRTEEGGDHTEPPQPTFGELPGLIEESRAAGVLVTLDNRIDDLTEVPTTTGRNAYRILQGALTNARKHAPGRPVLVEVRGTPGTGLSGYVRNTVPAKPVSDIPGAGLGLVGMRERAELAGGRLDFRRTTAEFELSVWLPWPA
ncbi:sensor histidine kinase [Amycolatopsis sp. CA-230715]|uniref:sensor histidine kinase n=1 Tax=Amycolatopsis sp. CA-230715 TaxID=2745196 RepID=UPI001C0237B4|nr:histidine kinase [Amycolatopsis sp. CA-230715]